MTQGSNNFLQFNDIPYPLWRRQMPTLVKAALHPLLARYTAMKADQYPPEHPQAMAEFMACWGLLEGLDTKETASILRADNAPVEMTKPTESVSADAGTGKLRLPAQWESLETILLTWPVLFPQLWSQHAQMAESIAPVAKVTIVVCSPMWAKAARLYLANRGKINLDRVRFLILPTDDIWVRDYGPIVGLDERGEQVCVKAVFDPLPTYPQTQDNAMALRWAAHEELPVRRLDLHIEGGNIWSDGAGTLIVADQVYHSNPGLTYEALAEKLGSIFDLQKLIVIPRLEREETGHVDLVCKLASADTVLVSAPKLMLNSANLRTAAETFRREKNASGESYRVLELPVPPLYLNWGLWRVWRTYTNALTVNGRVLVPVFGVPSDDAALRVYEQAMPKHEIIPIDSRIGANGGGAVHCLTKEIPAPRSATI